MKMVLTGLGALLVLVTNVNAAQLAAVKRGEQVYKSLCWTCHGPYGRGEGPASKYLAFPPPDLTDPNVLGKKSDREIIAGLMEAQAQAAASHRTMAIGDILQKQALEDAVAYIRTLAVPGRHVSLSAGRDIYNTFCATCHGVRGDGRGPAAKNLVGATPRDFTSADFVVEGHEEEIRKAIFEGAVKSFHGSPYMPEWKNTLSREQVLDVVEYLKTFKQPPR